MVVAGQQEVLEHHRVFAGQEEVVPRMHPECIALVMDLHTVEVVHHTVLVECALVRGVGHKGWVLHNLVVEVRHIALVVDIGLAVVAEFHMTVHREVVNLHMAGAGAVVAGVGEYHTVD